MKPLASKVELHRQLGMFNAPDTMQELLQKHAWKS